MQNMAYEQKKNKSINQLFNCNDMRTITFRTVIFVALLGLVSVLTSCDNDKKREEYVKVAESRSTSDLLNDLYVGSEGDVEAMARILNCTPSSIERIRNEETVATSQFAERVVDVSVYYYVNGQSFSKLRAALDDEWKWYNDVLYFPKHHAFWFWTINILLLIGVGLVMLYAPGVIAIELITILLEGILIFICWIIMLICSPGDMPDRYQDTINPTVEQIDF